MSERAKIQVCSLFFNVFSFNLTKYICTGNNIPNRGLQQSSFVKDKLNKSESFLGAQWDEYQQMQ